MRKVGGCRDHLPLLYGCFWILSRCIGKSHQIMVHFLQENIRRCAMKLKTDDPFVPEDIRAKINELQSLLDHAADLYSDIYSWYDSELKSYDPKATADDELFDPGTGTVVEGIDYLSIMESLSELQTANECKMQRD